MNRYGIIFSIVLSIVLIGGAFAMKMIGPDRSNPSILAVESGSLQSNEDLFLEFNKATTTAENLTEVDMVSRQLFTDYLDLRSSGQATPENLASLAGQYVDGLLETEVPETVTMAQVRVVAETDASLEAYDRAIAGLLAEYQASAGLLGREGEEYSDVFSEDFTNLMKIASIQYKRAAEEFITLDVPASLAVNHMNLVNSYLMSSQRLNIIARVNQNPISALMAMGALSSSAQDEEGLVANIKVRVMSRGLTSNL